MHAKIIFADTTEMSAEMNGDSFILDEKPEFPSDLPTVTVQAANGEYVYRNAEIIECASIDGRYWFALRELSPEELNKKETDNTIQMLTDCLLEMSETVYA